MAAPRVRRGGGARLVLLYLPLIGRNPRQHDDRGLLIRGPPLLARPVRQDRPGAVAAAWRVSGFIRAAGQGSRRVCGARRDGWNMREEIGLLAPEPARIHLTKAVASRPGQGRRNADRLYIACVSVVHWLIPHAARLTNCTADHPLLRRAGHLDRALIEASDPRTDRRAAGRGVRSRALEQSCTVVRLRDSPAIIARARPLVRAGRGLTAKLALINRRDGSRSLTPS